MGSFDSLRGDPTADKREEIAEALHDARAGEAESETSRSLRDAGTDPDAPSSDACPPQQQ